MQFVDTNSFIRFLIRDDPQKAAACRQLFERARMEEVELTTSEAVIAEVVYVLSSKQLYALSRQEVRMRLYPILALPGIKLPYKEQYLRALDLYDANAIDFEDVLSIASMERQGLVELFSYDQDFDRVLGSTMMRLEP
jgi:predicted nucleic acid-binding protein